MSPSLVFNLGSYAIVPLSSCDPVELVKADCSPYGGHRSSQECYYLSFPSAILPLNCFAVMQMRFYHITEQALDPETGR